MPRFVEVATPINLAEAALKRDAFSLFSGMGFTSFNFTSGFHAIPANYSTGFELGGRAGAANILLAIACALWAVRAALLRSATKRAVAQFGHARGE